MTLLELTAFWSVFWLCVAIASYHIHTPEEETTAAPWEEATVAYTTHESNRSVHEEVSHTHPSR